MGMVQKKISGKDGRKRGVEIWVVNQSNPQILTRPIQKINPLEISIAKSEKKRVCRDRRSKVGCGSGM